MSTAPPPTKRFGAAFEAMSIEETAVARDFEPSAFSLFYAEESRPKPYRMAGDVAVVEILDALDTRAGWWWDGYDAVVERTRAALADPAVKALVLAIDSPGGMAAGNLDAAHAMRAAIDASGKPCLAHAGTMACSAAYALACAADAIHVTGDGAVGSIGTIATVYDRTAMNEKLGLDVRVVRSGSLKADPHPDAPLTDASVARVRTRINELAAMFAAWVALRRPAMGDPLTLQGAVVYGPDAVTRGLADAVGTLADAITTAASMAADATRKKTMDATAAKSLETLATLRASLGVTTDEEAIATVATLRQRAVLADSQATEIAALRQQLADRDAAGVAKARADVIDRHLQRGGLTPAMQADAAFTADLAPLSPEALDRVLSKLPGVAVPVVPREEAPLDTKARSTAPVGAREREFAAATGVSLDAITQVATRDAAPKED